MAYQVLARKWRPKLFDDVIGQTHVTQSLRNAIVQNKIAHAYLLAGTRGVGKTSIARIFAKAIRCEHPDPQTHNPCLECPACKDIDGGSSIDVLEIDGASNNGVENIRQIVENVQYLPSFGKYKIYIVDEVHMLSTSAFNALLKTLEEPPKHVIFIFATTEPEKLLETVLSRCQRFDLRHIAFSQLVNELGKIAQKENIRFENPEILNQIAVQGNGSMRDALSLLDQVLSYSSDNFITEASLQASLGLARTSAIKDMLDALLSCDANTCSKLFEAMVEENTQLANIVRSLADELYRLIISEKQVLDLSKAELFWVYETLVKDTSWSLGSINPEKVTEIVFRKICCRREFFQADAPVKEQVVAAPVEKPMPVPVQAPTPVPVPEVKEVNVEEKNWDGFLSSLFKISPVMAANLEQGNILKLSGDVIEIGFAESERIFCEFLKAPENQERLKTYLAEYFANNGFTLTLTILDERSKSEKQFQSKQEINEVKEQELLKNREESLRNHPMLKKTEEIFQSKVDKVIINPDKKGN